MTGVTIAEETRTPSAAVAVEERKAVPVKIWATIGGLILAFELYVVIKWVTGPFFTPVHTGVTPVPSWMKASLISMEIGFTLLWLWCCWHFIVKPWRRDRRLSTDGLLCLCFFVFCWFQDPLADYGGAVFTYNSYLVNVGSWLNEVPGAVIPGHAGHQLPEPLWTAAIYPGVIFLATLLGTWIMRRAKARWPRMGPVGLIGTVFAFFVAFDVILEGFILMPLGAYTYAGAPNWSSINSGHFYKYTVLEGVFFGAAWTCWASLRYFKDDHGRTIVERGIDRVNASEAQKTLLRFFALGGFLAVTMFVCVNVPYFWTASHASAYPRDTLSRSYFTDGICGAGTNTACPGPNVPVPQGNGSARVGPNGTLEVPPGTRLPMLVPLSRR
ncbi:MAG: spirocyclase AveC family protein [Solirubrobacteraceae bacterium]